MKVLGRQQSSANATSGQFKEREIWQGLAELQARSVPQQSQFQLDERFFVLICSSGTTRTTRTRHAVEHGELNTSHLHTPSIQLTNQSTTSPDAQQKPFWRDLRLPCCHHHHHVFLVCIQQCIQGGPQARRCVSRAQHICQQQLRPWKSPGTPADSIYCCASHAGPSSPTVPPQPTQMGQSKPVPVGHASLAHPHHHEGPTDLDLYRTFSPSDVGMWSWQATTGVRSRERSAALLLVQR